MLAVFAAGFALSISLILAIGAQNAFVLRQGLRQAHVGAVVAICCLSETILIAAGVAGFGALAQHAPWALEVMRWGGVIFLILYAAKSFRAAWAEEAALTTEGHTHQSLAGASATALVLTWANPHVYLDTVGLIGAVSSTYGPARWVFGAGALTASILFFVVLGYGARVLAPIFASPSAWRILDAVIGLTMVIIAGKLAFFT